ncbi:U7 snRNA-associated Sm-like protein LSm11 isoform X2 [Euwallacea fornicatus]|uniref:U7 snRNA-associated Sm-like protein LSm11 isoform X2 n=1 Tax=Euwallacea fornicatus TaxID=995702 RepID=UPI00338D6F53
MKLSIVSKQPGICQLQTITKTTMADNSGSRRCTSKKVTKSSDSIAELDIYSEKFDPLAFLLSEQAKIPRPDAKVFDNLAKWQSHHQQKSRQDVEKKKTPGKSDLPARRWLPHQLPVDTRRPQRSPRNVLTKIQTIQGPLALLRKFMEEKTRIKIVTRNEKGVRGYCNAYLLAFDKHWNLVLGEVEEVWMRSIRVRTNPLLIVPSRTNGG